MKFARRILLLCALYALIPGVGLAHHDADALPAVTITYTDRGFLPAEVSIEQGQRVRWVNESTHGMWVASNVHPTHAAYDGTETDEHCGISDSDEMPFDACKDVSPGESYSFNFPKAGTWQYHNHSHAQDGGVVIVHAARNSENTGWLSVEKLWDAAAFWTKVVVSKTYYAIFLGKLEQLVRTSDIYALTEPHVEEKEKIRHLLAVAGPVRVIDRLAEQAPTPHDCHQRAHRVGRLAYDVYGGAAFANDDASLCHSGYYHGVMEAFISSRGSKDLIQSAGVVCDRLRSPFNVSECVHGMGHGVLAYLNYDLPAAISECEKFGAADRVASCLDGVFMENIVSSLGSGIVAHKTPWVSNDPLFPCIAVAQSHEVRHACYFMQANRMLSISNYDFKKTVPLCGQVPAGHVSRCFEGYGRDAAGIHNARHDIAVIQQRCSYVPAEHYDACIRGAAYYLTYGPNIKDEADKLCNTLSEPSRNICHSFVEERKVIFESF